MSFNFIYNRALSASEVSDLYNNNGYTTTNYPGRVLVRKYASPEPTVASLGAEKTQTVRIANGTLYVNQNASGSLNVTYSNFTGGDSSIVITDTKPVSPVPEMVTAALVGIGVAGMIVVRRRT